jgi:putative endopeptidase
MDLSVKPGDDFYNYASGKWIKNNPVPPKETRWGSFNQLREFNIQAVKKILENAAADKNALPGSTTKRVGDFYASGMDSNLIDKLGKTPVLPYLERVDKITTRQGIIEEANYLRIMGLASPMFGFYIGQDRKNIEKMVPQLGQGGTSLPDRDYYLKSEGRNLTIQEAFKKYITTLFMLVDEPAAKAEKYATQIYDIEKKLATAQMSRVEMRDPYKTYNKFWISDFNKTTPGLNWNQILTQLKVKGEDTIFKKFHGKIFRFWLITIKYSHIMIKEFLRHFSTFLDTKYHSNIIWRFFNLRFKQLRHGFITRVIGICFIPIHENFLMLC